MTYCRYGYQPLPLQIDKYKFEKKINEIHEQLSIDPSKQDILDMLEQWYILDTNTIPPCYTLRLLKNLTKDDINIYWNKILPTLRDIFEEILFDEKRCNHLYIGRSVTEWEITAAILIDNERVKDILWSHREFVHGVPETLDNRRFYFDAYNPITLNKFHNLIHFMKNNVLSCNVYRFDTSDFQSYCDNSDIWLQQFEQWKVIILQRLIQSVQEIILSKQDWDRCSDNIGTVCSLTCDNHDDANSGTLVSSSPLQVSGMISTEWFHHSTLANRYLQLYYSDSNNKLLLTKLLNIVLNDTLICNKEYHTITYVRLCIHGTIGCGKSSLLTKLANMIFQHLHNNTMTITTTTMTTTTNNMTNTIPIVIIRYCSTSSYSNTIRNILLSICQQIILITNDNTNNEYNTILFNNNTNTLTINTIVHIFHQLLYKYTIIIILDNIDKLVIDNDIKDIGYSFLIIPPCYYHQCCHHSKIILSYTTIDSDDYYLNINSFCNIHNIVNLDMNNNMDNIGVNTINSKEKEEEIVIKQHLQLIDYYLTRLYQRTLSSLQYELITIRLQSTIRDHDITVLTPYTAELIGYITKTWTSGYTYNTIDETLQSTHDLFFPSSCTLTSLIQHIVIMLQRNYGSILVEGIVCLFTCTNIGLQDTELIDIISLDDRILNSIFQYSTPERRRLPLHVWYRIRLELYPLLLYENELQCLQWKQLSLYDILYNIVFQSTIIDKRNKQEKLLHYNTLLIQYYSNMIDYNIRNERRISTQPIFYDYDRNSDSDSSSSDRTVGLNTNDYNNDNIIHYGYYLTITNNNDRLLFNNILINKRRYKELCYILKSCQYYNHMISELCTLHSIYIYYTLHEHTVLLQYLQYLYDNIIDDSSITNTSIVTKDNRNRLIDYYKYINKYTNLLSNMNVYHMISITASSEPFDSIVRSDLFTLWLHYTNTPSMLLSSNDSMITINTLTPSITLQHTCDKLGLIRSFGNKRYTLQNIFSKPPITIILCNSMSNRYIFDYYAYDSLSNTSQQLLICDSITGRLYRKLYYYTSNPSEYDKVISIAWNYPNRTDINTSSLIAGVLKSMTNGNSIHIWNAITGILLVTIPHNSAYRVHWHPENPYWVWCMSGCGDTVNSKRLEVNESNSLMTITLYDVSNNGENQCIKTIDLLQTYWDTLFHYVPYWASSSNDGKESILKRHGGFESVSVSPNGKYLSLGGSSHNLLCVCDVRSMSIRGMIVGDNYVLDSYDMTRLNTMSNEEIERYNSGNSENVSIIQQCWHSNSILLAYLTKSSSTFHIIAITDNHDNDDDNDGLYGIDSDIVMNDNDNSDDVRIDEKIDDNMNITVRIVCDHQCNEGIITSITWISTIYSHLAISITNQIHIYNISYNTDDSNVMCNMLYSMMIDNTSIMTEVSIVTITWNQYTTTTSTSSTTTDNCVDIELLVSCTDNTLRTYHINYDIQQSNDELLSDTSSTLPMIAEDEIVVADSIGHLGPILSITIVGSRYLLSTSMNCIVVWDILGESYDTNTVIDGHFNTSKTQCNGKPLYVFSVFGNPYAITYMTITQDIDTVLISLRIATATDFGSIVGLKVYDSQTDECFSSQGCGHTANMICMEWNPYTRGTQLLTSSEDGSLYLWNVPGTKSVPLVHTAVVYSIAPVASITWGTKNKAIVWCKDGQLFVLSIDETSMITLYGLSYPKELIGKLSGYPMIHTNDSVADSVSSDDSFVFVCGYQRQISLWYSKEHRFISMVLTSDMITMWKMKLYSSLYADESLNSTTDSSVSYDVMACSYEMGSIHRLFDSNIVLIAVVYHSFPGIVIWYVNLSQQVNSDNTSISKILTCYPIDPMDTLCYIQWECDVNCLNNNIPVKEQQVLLSAGTYSGKLYVWNVTVGSSDDTIVKIPPISTIAKPIRWILPANMHSTPMNAVDGNDDMKMVNIVDRSIIMTSNHYLQFRYRYHQWQTMRLTNQQWTRFSIPLIPEAYILTIKQCLFGLSNALYAGSTQSMQQVGMVLLGQYLDVFINDGVGHYLSGKYGLQYVIPQAMQFILADSEQMMMLTSQVVTAIEKARDCHHPDASYFLGCILMCGIGMIIADPMRGQQLFQEAVISYNHSLAMKRLLTM